MAKGYKPRRVKLKSHDSGSDRHNKPVAYEMKKKRQSQDHQNTVSGRRGLKRMKPAQVTASLTEQEVRDIQCGWVKGLSIQELSLMFHTTEEAIHGCVA